MAVVQVAHDLNRKRFHLTCCCKAQRSVADAHGTYLGSQPITPRPFRDSTSARERCWDYRSIELAERRDKYSTTAARPEGAKGDVPTSDNQASGEGRTMKTIDSEAAGKTTVTGQVVNAAGKGIPASASGHRIAIARFGNGQPLGKRPAPARSDQGRRRRPIPDDDSKTLLREISRNEAGRNRRRIQLGWGVIGDDVDKTRTTVSLATEQTVRGRVLDANGKPVTGAEVYVISVGKEVANDFDGIQCLTPPSPLPFWPRSWADRRRGPLRASRSPSQSDFACAGPRRGAFPSTGFKLEQRRERAEKMHAPRLAQQERLPSRRCRHQFS